MKIRIDASFYIGMSAYLLLMPLPWVAGAVLAGAVHELGHIAAIRLSGGQVFELRLGAFGARIETEHMEGKRGLLCARAGPGAGALVCLMWKVFPQAAVCAGVQTLFNLLPIYPFDGGRALQSCCKIGRFGVQ